MVRRPCVLCGQRVRRSDRRAMQVWVRDDRPRDGLTMRGAVWGLLGMEPQRSAVAHGRCMVPSDAALAKFMRAK